MTTKHYKMMTLLHCCKRKRDLKWSQIGSNGYAAPAAMAPDDDDSELASNAHVEDSGDDDSDDDGTHHEDEDSSAGEEHQKTAKRPRNDVPAPPPQPVLEKPRLNEQFYEDPRDAVVCVDCSWEKKHGIVVPAILNRYDEPVPRRGGVRADIDGTGSDTKDGEGPPEAPGSPSQDADEDADNEGEDDEDEDEQPAPVEAVPEISVFKALWVVTRTPAGSLLTRLLQNVPKRMFVPAFISYALTQLGVEFTTSPWTCHLVRRQLGERGMEATQLAIGEAVLLTESHKALPPWACMGDLHGSELKQEALQFSLQENAVLLLTPDAPTTAVKPK
jgi:hypothetical protein